MAWLFWLLTLSLLAGSSAEAGDGTIRGGAETAESLESSCTDVQVLGGDGASGVECQTDDDVPEQGDFGNAKALNANGNLVSGSVTGPSMGTNDFTFFSCDLIGTCTMDTGAVGSTEVEDGSIGSADVDSSIQTLDGMGNLQATGWITGKARIVNHTSSAVLSSPDDECSFHTNLGSSGSIELDLPDSPQGGCLVIYAAAANAIVVDPQGAIDCTLGAGCDIILGETNQNGENLTSSGTIGDRISLRKIEADRWAASLEGTWTQETP